MRRTLLAVLAVTLAAPTLSVADVLSSKSRNRLYSSQTRVLDDRASQQYNSSVRLRPDPVVAPTKWGAAPAYDGNYRGQYLQMARSAAQRHGIPESLFLRLVQQESGWNPRAKSHKGALGLAQLMPFTAAKLGVDPADPGQNLEGGARYLKMQYRRFGSWRLALAAYNAGPNAVEKYDGVPPYKETLNYVKVIWGS